MDDYRNEAVRTLEALVNHLDRLPPNHTPEAARLCAKACLKLGEWTEILAESAPTTSGGASFSHNGSPHRSLFGGSPITDEQTATEQVIRHYARSTEYDKDWHKAWHKLASAYFTALSRDKELSQAVAAAAVRSPHTRLIHSTPPPPIPPQPAMGLIPPVGAPIPPPLQAAPMTQPMMPVTVNTAGVPLLPVGPPPPPGAPPGPMMQLIPPQLSPMPIHNPSLATPPPSTVPVNIAYAVSAVKCFTRALQLAPDTLRLLQLWFDYGEYNEVYKQLSENIKGLPIETWLEAVPQLMARLDSRDKMAMLIKQVILEISKMKPQ
ncbi:hypothetical protein OSTOST_17134, partial [Ostertagia ostertagi]